MRFPFPVNMYALAFLCLAVIGEAGCGGGPTTSAQKISTGSASLPSITLLATPSTINSGATTTLSWTSSQATSVTIMGLGTFGASGSTTVSPSATTTYTAVANGPGGSTDAKATVVVSAGPPPPPSVAGVPTFSHVFLLVEENHGYSSVIGNSTMPYLNSLASQYGLATQYYANVHPSIGNYFMMTTGQMPSTNDGFTGIVTVNTIVDDLLTAGKTWKSYAESLPSVGYIGGDQGPYLRRHNPFTYFQTVQNSTSQLNNLVPFTEFAADLQNNALPDLSFIVPNALDDAHDGTLDQADTWLKQNIGPLIASAVFQKSLLVIVFDEAETTDTTHGGGHVAALVISPLAKKAHQSSTLYQHQSTLRLILEALGVNSFPGAAAGATDPVEFF